MQRPNPEARRAAAYLVRLSRRLEAPLRDAIRAAGRTLSPSGQQQLIAALAANDVERAVTVLWDDAAVRSAWATVQHTYARQVIVASQAANTALTVRLRVQSAAPVLNPTLIRAVRTWEDTAFAEIQRSARNGMRALVADALETGVGPRAAARTIQARMRYGGGMTEYDRGLVRSFREQLRTDPRAALNRTLRDRRYDATVRRAMDRAMAKGTEDKLVAAYERKLAAWRAQTFARTSALQAANDGERVAWRQAVDDGAVAAEAVRRYWIVAEDERMCELCEPVPSMNPNGVGLDQTFQTPLGPRDGPVLHPNCRCTTWTRIERADFAPAPTPGIIRAIAPPAPR